MKGYSVPQVTVRKKGYSLPQVTVMKFESKDIILTSTTNIYTSTPDFQDDFLGEGGEE